MLSIIFKWEVSAKGVEKMLHAAEFRPSLASGLLLEVGVVPVEHRT